MSAFSNGTEWEIWSANWCDVCKVDEPAREREDFENGCPLILDILTGSVPAEFMEQPPESGDRYHCINFRGPDDGLDEPQHPENPLPGQGELIPRADYEHPKVFADIANEIRRVNA